MDCSFLIDNEVLGSGLKGRFCRAITVDEEASRGFSGEVDLDIDIDSALECLAGGCGFRM